MGTTLDRHSAPTVLHGPAAHPIRGKFKSFPFVLCREQEGLSITNTMTKEFVNLGECKAIGLLNQKLVKVTPARSVDKTTFFTTHVDNSSGLNFIDEVEISSERAPDLF